MNQHLKQAIAAARAGKTPQAKVLLARVIKDEPENVNAWFLLSSLADTEEQKVQHLKKVLELQPDHATASQQLTELVPPPPAAEEEALFDTADSDSDATPEIFPLPDIDLPIDDAPEDPDEAMAWLERLAADQGAPLDELPSMTDESETADTAIFEMPTLEDAEEIDNAPEDPDEAMAWLEQLAATQGAPMDELPSMFEEAADDETYDWLDEIGDEDEVADTDTDYLEMLPTLIDEVPETSDLGDEDAETAEPTKTLSVSDETFDFVSQAEGDSIPSWLVGDEDYISADTVITAPAEEVEEDLEPENLPDWLNEMPGDDWEGEEGEKSGQVVWKAGEEDESLKPKPPGSATSPESETKAKPVAKKTAAASNSSNNNFLLAILVVIALLLLFAILYLLFV